MQSIPKTVLSLMWYFIKPQFWRFLILITAMLGWSVQESVYPYFIKLFIDQITKPMTRQISVLQRINNRQD